MFRRGRKEKGRNEIQRSEEKKIISRESRKGRRTKMD